MEKESIINRLDRLNQLRRYKHGWLIDDNNLDTLQKNITTIIL